MTKRAKKTPTSKPRLSSRSGAAWPPAAATPPELGPVERETFFALLTLRAELGREPEPAELGKRLGLRDPSPWLNTLARLGLPAALTTMQTRCLRAIIALEERHGRSPSTREVSAEMGLSPSGSRYHINSLVALGLVTPPEVRLVLSATPAGRAQAATF